ncbi:MAG TPA: L,D-transpeptidase family protein [Vicinamibacteria bacterium]|nr:L,D-transpeptidase family protein [Vicinamibacteria bacterium]
MLGLVLAAIAQAGSPAASPVPTNARQMVLAIAAGWDATSATLRAYERPSADARWREVGPAFPASLGRSGLAWGRGLQPAGLPGPQKREGDGRSPAGVFDLRLVTGYAEAPPPGSRLPYRPAGASLLCVDDPRSPHYNSLVDARAVPRDWSSAEEMRRDDALYRYVVWVGHNDRPVEPGGGSCIFLHLRASPQAVTAGCTAFELPAMQRLLRWLDPAARPVLVQLPESERRARGVGWGLPDQGRAAER